VTEHDPYILSNCDYIIEMGRGGGSEGGSVIAKGTPAELMGLTRRAVTRLCQFLKVLYQYAQEFVLTKA
jgi:excinuclease UvrABC ATPase subunit